MVASSVPQAQCVLCAVSSGRGTLMPAETDSWDALTLSLLETPLRGDAEEKRHEKLDYALSSATPAYPLSGLSQLSAFLFPPPSATFHVPSLLSLL